MNMNRLGVVALAIFGINYLAHGLIGLGSMIIHMVDPPAGFLLPIILQVLACSAGLAILRWRHSIADLLFRDDDTPIGRISLEDAQTAGIAILGVWMFAEALPEFIERFVWVPRTGLGDISPQYERYPIGQFVADLLPALIGIFLILRGQVLTKLWSRQLQQGANS